MSVRSCVSLCWLSYDDFVSSDDGKLCEQNSGRSCRSLRREAANCMSDEVSLVCMFRSDTRVYMFPNDVPV